jgi:fructokinase
MASNTSLLPATGEGLIVSFGEMLIDFVPTVSGVSLAEAPGFLKAPGGAPANVAIAVSRLGGKSAFVGKLGDDEFGHMLAGILKENNVRADGINFDKGARTALAFVTLRADGEREFMFYRNPSADMLLTPEDLNLELIRSVCKFSSLNFLFNFYFILFYFFPYSFSGKFDTVFMNYMILFHARA